jgi:hypothetical protein
MSARANIGDTWYRVEDGSEQNWVREFHVVKVTPCGVRLSDGFGAPRMVLDGARKRYACPTRKEAMESFICRKRRQLKILRAQIQRVERALFDATGGVPPEYAGLRLLDSEDVAS